MVKSCAYAFSRLFARKSFVFSTRVLWTYGFPSNSGLSVTNYRSLEALTLSFPTYYAALCGRNNAGKTNVVRAIRSILPEESPFSMLIARSDPSYGEDFPAWKKKGTEPIVIAVTLDVDPVRDAGLHAFIGKFTTVPEGQPVSLQLTVTRNSDASQLPTRVEVSGAPVEDFAAAEIVKKLSASTAVFFHNSTELEGGFPFRYRRSFGGILGEFSTSDQAEVARVQKRIDAFLRSTSKRFQKDVSALLGRLEDQYRVTLAPPRMDLETMPVRISLGSRQYSVPLDEWGSGTQNRTRVFLTLLKAKQASESPNLSDRITPVLVIEEPESFLHPSAQAEFGRVLRELAEEFQVQVLTTTHSPYMLSCERPEANILLERATDRGKESHGTRVVPTSGESWMEPFALALGIDNREFAPWQHVLHSRSNNALLVEGDLDKAYFELLRDPAHGPNQLAFEGAILPYGGKDALKNCTMLRFILGQYARVFITFDLDAEADVQRHLTALSLERGKHFLPVGLDQAGKRDIEGLLPDSVRKDVYAAHPDLVTGAMSAQTDERKSAKSQLKKILLDAFKAQAKPGPEAYGHFYKLAASIRRTLNPTAGI